MTLRGQSAHQVRVVLVGRPNSGKSSLFNALAAKRRPWFPTSRARPAITSSPRSTWTGSVANWSTWRASIPTRRPSRRRNAAGGTRRPPPHQSRRRARPIAVHRLHATRRRLAASGLATPAPASDHRVDEDRLARPRPAVAGRPVRSDRRGTVPIFVLQMGMLSAALRAPVCGLCAGAMREARPPCVRPARRRGGRHGRPLRRVAAIGRRVSRPGTGIGPRRRRRRVDRGRGSRRPGRDRQGGRRRLYRRPARPHLQPLLRREVGRPLTARATGWARRTRPRSA